MRDRKRLSILHLLGNLVTDIATCRDIDIFPIVVTFICVVMLKLGIETGHIKARMMDFNNE